jgi:hypothetical protein
VDDALATAIKAAKAAYGGVDSGKVDLSCSVQGSRRLSSDRRRLAGVIEFAYRIEMESAAAASALAATLASADPAEVTDAIRGYLPEGSTISFTVLRLTATAVTVTITTTSTVTAGEDLDDSHASMPTVLGPVAMALSVASLIVFQ